MSFTAMTETLAAEGRLIWIDLEMTGLDTDHDSVIEIATVITDANLNVLAEGPELAIAHDLATLEAMDDWNRNQHRRSGLWQRVLEQGVTMREAELRTIQFLQRYFHYRNLDVSTLKELARRWAPHVLGAVHKESAHTALSDVRDSISELRYYRSRIADFAS
jgi:oligoribonuclease